MLELPLRARVVDAANEIDAVRGCVAFERGPLVYCVEGMDLPAGVNLDAVSVDASTAPADRHGFDVSGHPVVALSLKGQADDVPPPHGWPYPELNGDRTSPSRSLELSATPYYSWGNRGATSMRVWVPRSAR